jgi:hypothetical protein
LRDKKNKYSKSRVVRKKNSERNKKPYPPSPLQVKWSVPNKGCNRYECKWKRQKNRSKLKVQGQRCYCLNHSCREVFNNDIDRSKGGSGLVRGTSNLINVTSYCDFARVREPSDRLPTE